MKITKTCTITANESLMRQVERFLACLHWFSHWGHSSYIGFSQDGDGQDKATVEGEDFDINKYRVYADWRCNYPTKVRAIDCVDPSMKDKDYIEYRKKWTERYGDSYEGEPQPWKDEEWKL